MRKAFGCMLLVLSVAVSFFGCTGKPTGKWISLTYHVTAMEREEGCHFTVIRQENMSLSGYCVDNGTEYRIEQPVPMAEEAAQALLQMNLDQTAAEHKRVPGGAADETRVTVTLEYPDGFQRELSLNAQEKEQLRKLLQEELTRSVDLSK